MAIRWAGRIGALFVCFSLLTGAGIQGVRAAGDPLPSWRAGAARDAIVDFIARVTDPSDEDFVAVAERVAVFDNDGTLIVEQPTAIQFAFMLDRVNTLARDRPDWASTQPFQAVLEEGLQAMPNLDFAERRAIGVATAANMTEEEYAALVDAFVATSRHPRFQTRYTDAVYQPMLELIELLQANDFKLFIVSGGGIEFIRSYSEPVYGIPRENVIGSSRKLDLRERDGRLVIFRKTGLARVNAARFKPLSIQLHTGRRPVLAVGNSDGDLEMLRYTDGNEKPSLVLLVQHDDADREYAYSDDSVRVRQVAKDAGWQIVSMHEDFARVFPEDSVP
jgi:hypothetical protein